MRMQVTNIAEVIDESDQEWYRVYPCRAYGPWEEGRACVVVYTREVKGRFKCNFKYGAYPMDIQRLRVRVRSNQPLHKCKFHKAIGNNEDAAYQTVLDGTTLTTARPDSYFLQALTVEEATAKVEELERARRRLNKAIAQVDATAPPPPPPPPLRPSSPLPPPG